MSLPPPYHAPTQPYKRPDLQAAWKAGRRAGKTAVKHWVITGQQVAFNRGFTSALAEGEAEVMEHWYPEKETK